MVLVLKEESHRYWYRYRSRNVNHSIGIGIAKNSRYRWPINRYYMMLKLHQIARARSEVDTLGLCPTFKLLLCSRYLLASFYFTSHVIQTYKFDILKKTQEQKTQNSRKKLNNSSEKLKDTTKFTQRRKKF